MDERKLHVNFVVETCCRDSCGITYAFTSNFYRQRKKDHKTFYCPRGHGQHYTQESEEERLNWELKNCRIGRDEWRAKAQRIERSRRSYMGHVTRLKNAMREDEPDENNRRDSTT